MKVFLGGTTCETTWREELIPLLKVDYFNPVVPDWTIDDMNNEIYQRGICDYSLFVITPKMQGLYTVAEVVDDSNKKPFRTILCVLRTDGELSFTEGQLRSILALERLVASNGAIVCNSLEEVATLLNNKLKEEGK